MSCFNKYSFINIKKKRGIEGVIIENNLHKSFDKLEKLICDIFVANGIEKVKFNGYSKGNNKIVIHINPKAYDDKLTRLFDFIDEVINKCDTDTEIIKVVVSNNPLTTIFPPLNTIEFSLEFMKKYGIEENENINLIDGKSGSFKICCAKLGRKLEGNSIGLNTSTREIFINSNHVFIQEKSNIDFDKVVIQSVNHILDGFITISEENRKWIEEHGGERFELLNEITGASMDISVDKIKFANLSKNIIKLNYFQRLVLECELPQKISRNYFNKYRDLVEGSEESIGILDKYYGSEKALTGEIIREEKDVFNHKRRIKKVLNECGYPRIALYPIVRKSDDEVSFFKRFNEKLLDIMIGGNRCNLRCIRPYETDESSNVVRISKGTLDLLGIEETDNLIISYRGKRVKARALVIDGMESIKDTNILQSESELNVCIGIPAHIRHQLGINKINVCCDVERDKGYLFKKNLNIQFISILATVLAVKQTFSDNDLLVLGLLVILMPFSVYIILSGVRNNISNK